MNDGQGSTTPAGRGQAKAASGEDRRRHNVTGKRGACQGSAPFLGAALGYAARGWPVFPLRHKLPAIPKNRGGNGYHDATTDPAELEALWARAGRGVDGLGVDLERAGLVLLDLDLRNGGNLDALCSAVGELPPTLAARTGSGGGHWLYRRPPECPATSRAGALGPGLDVKANGYAVLAPSRHPSGGTYAWTAGPGTVDLADAPAWLVAALSAPQAPRNGDGASGVRSLAGYVRAAVDGELVTLANAREGERNATLNRSAFSLGELVGAGHLSEGDALDVLRRGAMACGIWGDDGERSCLSTIRSGLEAGKAQPRMIDAPVSSTPSGNGAKAPTTAPERGGVTFCRPAGAYSMTDDGNALRLAALHGAGLRWCDDWRRWLAWDGRRWSRDRGQDVLGRARLTARSILHEAAEVADDKESAALAAFAGRSLASPRLEAMVSLARSDLAVMPEDLDRDPWALTVNNGTVDLRTGELRPHDRADLITRLAPVTYDPAAKAPTWAAFLDRIIPDAAVRVFLQRAAGYSMTADTREQCFLIPWGSGANGKSTFLAVLRALLGDYATETDPDTLLARQGGTGIPNDLAALRGARLVTAQEPDQGRRLAEGRVKALTGGDSISARFLHGEFFTFTPTFKLWLATNHRPVIRGTDAAIWRRVRLVPFEVTIPEPEQDRCLLARLLAELSGVLSWAIEGCIAWQRDGMAAPKAVTVATAAYREEQDMLGSWLADCCQIGPEREATTAALYASYGAWCEANGERPAGSRAFGTSLSERGFDQTRTKRARGWRGVGLAATGDG